MSKHTKIEKTQNNVLPNTYRFLRDRRVGRANNGEVRVHVRPRADIACTENEDFDPDILFSRAKIKNTTSILTVPLHHHHRF